MMPFLRSKYKLLVLLLIFVLLFIYLVTVSYNTIKCYRYKGETLPDISLIDVRKGKSIFFHETSCKSYDNGKIVITLRQACAVESAALLNPNLDVYLLFASPGIFKFEGTESDRFLQALLSYDNVKINHVNFENYTRGTPLEKLYSEGTIEASNFAMSHASDILRYLTLWKYGGIYIDLDVVVIKNLDSLPPNFSGCESTIDVGAGMMGFEPNGTGHLLAEECVMDLKYNFDGTEWGNNGPGVITRLVKRHCNVRKIRYAFDRVCDNFKVFPPSAFYRVSWSTWTRLFDEEYLQFVIWATLDSYIIHFWNKESYSTKLPQNSGSAYTTLARKFCPKVFRQCDNYF